jgi:hypothetical protein
MLPAGIDLWNRSLKSEKYYSTSLVGYYTAGCVGVEGVDYNKEHTTLSRLDYDG